MSTEPGYPHMLNALTVSVLPMATIKQSIQMSKVLKQMTPMRQPFPSCVFAQMSYMLRRCVAIWNRNAKISVMQKKSVPSPSAR